MGATTHDGVTISVDAVLADAETIYFAHADGARIIVPTGSSLTTLTFHESHNGTTFVSAFDSTGTAVTLTVAAGRSYPFPSTLNAAKFVRITGNADGTVILVAKQAGLIKGAVS